jgi:hypothetical protein
MERGDRKALSVVQNCGWSACVFVCVCGGGGVGGYLFNFLHVPDFYDVCVNKLTRW